MIQSYSLSREREALEFVEMNEKKRGGSPVEALMGRDMTWSQEVAKLR